VKNRVVIGIEITSSEIRGACARMGSAGTQLTGVASMPTPPGGVDQEGLINAHQVGDIVRSLCVQLDPKASQVVVGLTGCNLVARVMEIPAVPDPEVRAVLRGEMDHYRILPQGQSAFDFYRLPDLPTEEGSAPEEALSRVLLMGAEERLVSSYRSAIDASGLNLTAVEPGSVAALRAIAPLVHSDAADATIILSPVGTDIFITYSGALQFYRRVDTGLPELRIAQSVISGSTGPQQRPASLLGSPEDFEEFDNISIQTEQTTFNHQAVSLLVTEIQRSIDYFLREFTPANEKLKIRFIIGDEQGAELFKVIMQFLRRDAELVNDLTHLPISSSMDAALISQQGYRFIVAAGLALRKAGGDFDNFPILDLSVGDKVITERRVAPKVMLASMAGSGAVILATIVLALLVNMQISRANQTLQQAKNELASLTKEHADRVAMLDRQNNLVNAIQFRNKPMREAIEFISACVARRATLETIRIEDSGNIFVTGETFSMQTIADIMDTMNLSPSLEPVRLNSLQRIRLEQDRKSLRFDIQTAFLKRTAPTTVASAGTPAPAHTGGK
jgi:type IV pilus assembly protein PilM